VELLASDSTPPVGVHTELLASDSPWESMRSHLQVTRPPVGVHTELLASESPWESMGSHLQVTPHGSPLNRENLNPSTPQDFPRYFLLGAEGMRKGEGACVSFTV